MKPLVITSNLYNEIDQMPSWFENFKPIADCGILIVDSGSTDGTIEYCREQGAIVIVNDIIQKEGYGPARNHLRAMSRKYFKDAHWMAYFDADERISEKERHKLRFVKDNLVEHFDVVAFPRIDWIDTEYTKSANDFRIAPDFQSRMTRLNTPILYVRRLHEQITQHRAVYAKLTNPKINHLHRSAGVEKRDLIGKLCAKLHMEDAEWGKTYPEHPKEAMYREQYLKEGL